MKQVDPSEHVTIYKTLGYLYTKAGKTKKAIRAYLEAGKRDKKDVNLFYNLATLYEQSGQKDKADV